jgi:UDP-N-acetylmuramate--alanine ligase
MSNIEKLKKYKKIHMIGIGGVSMSGIAEILKHWGFTVTGSDASQSEYTDSLIAHNIPVVIGHDMENVANADLVVYTAAISQEDPELVKARQLYIPTIERSDFLGLLTKVFNDTICISGTHGKTTTTSMISSCFLEGKLDPTIQVGAYLNQINGNYRLGNSEYFIIEACEYVESFLKFYPKTPLLLLLTSCQD